MADASVLREYVIKLGWSNDEAGFKRFQETMGSISKGALELTKNFVAVGAAVGSTAVAAAVGLQKIAKPLESLYFAAQRTGASANELKALTGAFEQIGVSAEETQQAIEGFSAARRSMPGIDQMFRIDPKQTDNAKAFLQVLSQIANQDTGGAFTHAIAAQRAEYLGISEQTLTQFENNRGPFVKALQDRARIVDKYNVGKMAKDSHDYASKFRNTETNLELTADKVATGVMPAAGKVLDETSQLADLYNKIDDKTGGWLGHLTAVAGVSSSILATYKAIAALRGLLGGAAVAEGAGAAAGAAGAAGTAAVGGGLISVAVSMVAPVVAAVIGSHYLDKWTKGTWWDTDQETGEKPKEGEPQTTGIADQWAWLKGKVQPIMGAISKGMTDFVAGFEGHAKNGYGVYQDIGGHDTAGYGHLVKPGENLSGLDKQGAMVLLGKDLASATNAVKSLVHVALTGNQMKALTDFVFNLGAGNLEKSTLLKELNAGHYEAAAARFADYNKVLMNGHYVANEALARRRATEAETFRTPDAKPNITLTQKTDIHIEAGPNAAATADRVAGTQGRVNGDMVRNMSGLTS
jgi:GH24 family phage-related lysozyme (muramidase)